MQGDHIKLPKRMLAAMILTAILIPLNSTMIAVALPAITTAFDVTSGAATTWLVASYLIVNIVAVSPSGYFSDKLGRRRALMGGQALFAVGASFGGFGWTLEAVGTGRILMAAGGAMIIPTVMSVLREAFPPERRARAFASFGAVLGLSAGVGPLLGGILTARLNWQAIFFVNVPLLLIAWLLTRETAFPLRVTQPNPQGFDKIGALLLVTGLAMVTIGLKSSLHLGLLGFIAMLGFVWWERRAPNPLIDLQLFREKHFVAGGLVIALQNLSMYALIFQLPFLLEGSLAIGPERVGQVLLAMTLVMVVAAPLGGRLSERIGIRATALVGLITAAAGLILGLTAITNSDLMQLMGCLAGMGLGLGFVTGPTQAAALTAVPIDRTGIASGVLATMRYLGGIVGISAISIILDHQAIPDTLAAHRTCIWLYVLSHSAAIVIAVLLPKKLVEPAVRIANTLPMNRESID